MKQGKIIALVLGVIGVILCLLLMFQVPGSEQLKERADAGGSGVLTGGENSILSAGIYYSLFLLIVASLLFLYYKFVDLSKHPENKKEMFFVTGVIVIAVVIGFILNLITGGRQPVVLGNGDIYDNTSSLTVIGTFIWTTIVLLIMIVLLLIKNAISSSSNAKKNVEYETTE